MRRAFASVLFVLSVAAPANLLAADPRPATALIDAAINGNLARVQKLLDGGADPNSHDPGNGYTALHWAANGKRLALEKLLLSHHAKVDARNNDGATPLMFASGRGGNALVADLLAAGADANARNADGMGALAFAAEYDGTPETVALLIRKGADVEGETRNFDRPLSLAAEKGHMPVIGELLKDGANPGFALVWDVYRKRLGAVQALIDAGVDVNAPYPKAKFGPDEGTTALVEAASNDDVATVRLLIDHGANVNAVVPGTSNMPTALTFAAYHCDADMIRMLLDHGADRSFRNASGNSAADLARTGWTNDMQACAPEVQALLQ
jgi:ankyrin repeat protein